MKNDVLQILNQHRPQDAKEKESLSTLRSILHRSDRPFDKRSFSPGHFTASALCLSPDKESLLLIFHPVFNKWIQPGGHFEGADTSPLAAAKRELFEETGVLEVEDMNRVDFDIHMVPSYKDQSSHIHGDIRFWLRALHKDLEPIEGGHPAAWIPLKEMSSAKTDQSVILAVTRWLRLEG